MVHNSVSRRASPLPLVRLWYVDTCNIPNTCSTFCASTSVLCAYVSLHVHRRKTTRKRCDFCLEYSGFLTQL